MPRPPAFAAHGRHHSMIHGQSHEQQEPAPRFRWVFCYCLDGDLRFISHHDTLRLFRRALARAALPVRFSEGFNPHPRMTIPLPRPVGIASDAEAIVVELSEPIDSADALVRLEQNTPEGIRMLGARRLGVGEKLVPENVLYRFELVGAVPDDLSRRISDILGADEIIVKRTNHKSGTCRDVDIRPFIADIKPQRDAVVFCLNVTAEGSAKPSEIAAFFALDAHAVNHRIRRTDITWR